MEKAKETIQKLASDVKDATDRFSGKHTEELVTEYTELFTKIAIGLHEDSESVKKEADQIRTKQDEGIEALRKLDARISHMETLLEEHKTTFTQSLLELKRDISVLKEKELWLEDRLAKERAFSRYALAISLAAFFGVVWVII
mgnify:FL=1